MFFDINFTLKLGDFGFVAPVAGKDGSGRLKSLKGTRSYMAPEILARQPYNGIKTDLFAAGVMLFLLTMGRPPFMRAE